jgi:hypothetical protein
MEKFCQGLANLVSMQQTGFTCSCVGNPSIYDQSPNALFGFEVTLTHLNWRSTKTVLRENCTHAGTSLKLKYRDIFAVGFAHTCTGCAYFNARHGQQIGLKGGYEIDWHGSGELSAAVFVSPRTVKISSVSSGF